MKIERFLQIQMKLQEPITRALIPLLRYRHLTRRAGYYRDTGPHIQLAQLTQRGMVYQSAKAGFHLEQLHFRQSRCRYQPDTDECEIEPIPSVTEVVQSQRQELEAHHIITPEARNQ